MSRQRELFDFLLWYERGRNIKTDKLKELCHGSPVHFV